MIGLILPIRTHILRFYLLLWKKLTCCRISIKTMKIKMMFLLVNSRKDVSVRWSYDVYIAAQRMFSTQTISIQTRSVCIDNRNTTFFNHLPIRQSTTICWIIIIGHWIRIACREMSDYGAKYFGGLFSSRSLKPREKYISFAQFVYFLREVFLLFNFIIQKLKSKHISLKKYANWAKLTEKN